MSTEETSSDQTPNATLVALAGKVRLPAGVTGDADTLPKGTFSTNSEPHGYSGLEEAAFQFIHNQQQPATSPAPALALVTPEEDPALAQAKSDKAAKLIELDAEIAQTPEGPAKEALRQARKELESAKTPQAISAAVASATAAAASAAQGKADDKVVNINTMHKQLYDSDPEYRRKTDEISAAANKSISELDKALSETDQLAKDRGYVTGNEKNLAEKREAFEKLRDNPHEAPAARKAHVEYLLELEKDYKMREALARAKGDTESADKFKAALDGAIANGRQDAEKFYLDQQKAVYEAQEKALKGNPKAEELLNTLKLRQEEECLELFKKGKPEDILKGARELQIALREIKENREENSPVNSTVPNSVTPFNLKPENVNPADEKIASIVPNESSKSTREANPF